MAKHEEALRDLAMNDERFVERPRDPADEHRSIQPRREDSCVGTTGSSHRAGRGTGVVPMEHRYGARRRSESPGDRRRPHRRRADGRLARVVSAAPELALAIGYDVDAALEAAGVTGDRVRSEALSPTAQSATGCARVAGGDGGVVAGVARAPARCDAAVGTGGEPERHGVITGSEYGAKKRQILGI